MTTPPKFEGECPKCDKVAQFEEIIRERRAARSPMAANRGDFKAMMEYMFKCAACGARSDKVLDMKGDLHKWQGSRHITMHVGRE